MAKCQVCHREIDCTNCWNSHLEDLAELMQLKFPCKHQGCGAQVMLNQLNQHQNTCAFRPIRSHVKYETISPPVPLNHAQNSFVEYQRPTQHLLALPSCFISQQVQTHTHHQSVPGHVNPIPEPHSRTHFDTGSLELSRLGDNLNMAVPENLRNNRVTDQLQASVEHQRTVPYSSHKPCSSNCQHIQTSANHAGVSGHFNPIPNSNPEIYFDIRSVRVIRVGEKQKLRKAIPKHVRDKKSTIDTIEEHIFTTSKSKDEYLSRVERMIRLAFGNQQIITEFGVDVLYSWLYTPFHY